MNELNPLESEIIDKLLAGKAEWLSVLRQQVRAMQVRSRENTGAGFFTHFAVAADAPKLACQGSFQFGDVSAEINDLKHGAGFLLWIKNGTIDFLEGYSYDEPWPANVHPFHVHYANDVRDEDALTKRFLAACGAH
jgi:hypothetical protein